MLFNASTFVIGLLALHFYTHYITSIYFYCFNTKTFPKKGIQKQTGPKKRAKLSQKEPKILKKNRRDPRW